MSEINESTDNESTDNESTDDDSLEFEEKCQEGEIYKITCKENNKCYIGAAKKYIGKVKQKWGGYGRWVRHCRDAITPTTRDYDCELHKDIRDYGKDAFELEIICSSPIDKLFDLEVSYIKTYNTLHPNGYNMTEGGRKGKHCALANEKKKVTRQEYDDNSKINMSKGQIGKRYEKKERKNEEDNHLPKYVHPVRKEGKIVGYQVKKFPMGIETPEYIYKTYKNKNNIAKALQDSIDYVKKLEKDYEDKLIAYNEEKIKEEENNNLKLKSLPDNVFYILDDKTVIGYYVKNLKDYENKIIPRREFTECTNTNNYNHAINFIKIVKKFNDLKKTPNDWMTVDVSKYEKSDNLPKYVREIIYKGELTGYRVDYYIGKTESGEKMYERNTFSSKKLSMNEKLNLAINFIKEMDKIHTNTE